MWVGSKVSNTLHSPGASARQFAVRLIRPATPALALCVAVTLGTVPGKAEEPPHRRSGAEGPRIDRGVERPVLHRRACSYRVPVCVHGDGAREVLDGLDAAERMYEALTLALDVPAPDPDLATGKLEVYLTATPVADAPLGTRAFWSDIDRASAFVRVPRSLSRGCTLDTAMAEGLSLAAARRSAPAMDDATREGMARTLAQLAAGCPDGQRLAEAQVFASHPEVSWMTGFASGEGPSGAVYNHASTGFFQWLDRHYGAAPGRLMRMIWAFAPTKTPADSPRWVNEPDAFDVLGESLKDVRFTGSKLEDVLVDYAVERAFMGRGDPRFVDAEAPAPTIDWSIPWPEKARRLLSSRPIAQHGVSYVLVDHRGAPKGSRLRLEAEWEYEARIRWVCVKLDENFRERARISVGTPERATEAQMSLANLDDTAQILLVGVNLGDPKFPYDPDEIVAEPHAWLLSLQAE